MFLLQNNLIHYIMTEQSVDVDGDVLGLEDTIVSFKAQRHHGTGDGRVDSCLTACERDHRDILSIGLSTMPRRSQFGEGRRASEEYMLLEETSRGTSSPDETAALWRI
jgi:hypothetical protein